MFDAIEKAHGAEHLGSKRTCQKLAQTYTNIPKRAVFSYIKTCTICTLNGYTRKVPDKSKLRPNDVATLLTPKRARRFLPPRLPVKIISVSRKQNGSSLFKVKCQYGTFSRLYSEEYIEPFNGPFPESSAAQEQSIKFSEIIRKLPRLQDSLKRGQKQTQVQPLHKRPSDAPDRMHNQPRRLDHAACIENTEQNSAQEGDCLKRSIRPPNQNFEEIKRKNLRIRERKVSLARRSERLRQKELVDPSFRTKLFEFASLN